MMLGNRRGGVVLVGFHIIGFICNGGKEIREESWDSILHGESEGVNAEENDGRRQV